MTETNGYELYEAIISFDDPREAMVTIPAQDEKHARVLLERQFSRRRNFVIHDIHKVADVTIPKFDYTAIETPASFEDVRDTVALTNATDGDNVAKEVTTNG